MNLGTSYNKLFIDGVLMYPHVGYWHGAKGLNPEDLGLTNGDVADAYILGRKMLVPDEVIKKFRQLEGIARNLVDNNSFPFPIGNSKFVPRTKFNEVITGLQDTQTKFHALADEFITKFDEYRQQMLPIYQQAAEDAFERRNPEVQEFGIDADPEALRIKREQDKAAFVEQFLARIQTHYPVASSLRKRFYLEWDIYEISAPQMHLTTAEGVLQTDEAQQAAKAEAHRLMAEKINGFVSEVVTSLRQEATEVCNRVANAIRSGKVMRKTSFDSLRNFIDRFKDMNFVGDQSVFDQLDAVKREFLDAHTTETLTGNQDIQTALADRLQQVVAEAEKISEQDIDGITGQYVRVVNWQE
jgi:hypothetical protein